LEERIPFLTSSIKDFHCHAGSPHESSLVAELACASGYSSKVDPSLLTTLRQTPKSETDDEYLTSCLLMVFVAVSIPKLAKSESSTYQAQLEGHSNNIHCLAMAVNQLLGCLFSIGGHDDIEDRLKEFLALASSSLLRLGQEGAREDIRNRESVYILLHQIVQVSPFLSMVGALLPRLALTSPPQDLLESCFPYSLLRNSYHSVHRGVQPPLLTA
jgi:NCK-associated protein 1